MPIGLLRRHRISPVDELRGVTAAVALLAAEKGTIIPEQRTAPAAEKARNLIMDQTIPAAGHNDIYGNPELASAMQQAMKLIGDRIKVKPVTPD